MPPPILIDGDDVAEASLAAAMAYAVDEDDKKLLRYLSKNALRVNSPNDVPCLTQCVDGTNYDQYRGPNGTLHKAHGALIPAGYALDTSHPGRPWICPVDMCRITYMQMNGLGQHMNRSHGCKLLNDNLDGTFTVIGSYLVVGEVSGVVASARIISQHPPDGTPRPRAKPTLPYNKSNPARGSSTSSPSMPSAKKTVQTKRPLAWTNEGETMQSQADLSVSDPDALWAYLTPFMMEDMDHLHYLLATQHLNEMRTKQPIQSLLTLPRVRPLFRRHVAEVSAYNGGRLCLRVVFSYIVQVTGVVARTPCKRCSDGGGVFPSCVSLAVETNPSMRRLVESCANCFYDKRNSECSCRVSGPAVGSSSRTAVASQSQGAAMTQTSGHVLLRLSSLVGGGGGTTAASSRPFTPSSLSAASPQTDPLSGQVSLTTGTKRKSAVHARLAMEDASAKKSRRMTHDTLFATRKERQEMLSSKTPKAATTPPPPPSRYELLRTEDWEAAPGKIHGRLASGADPNEQPKTLAVSRPYVASRVPIRVWDDLELHVLTVGAVEQHPLTMNDRPRAVTVFSGKVKVTLEGEEDFLIGPLGSFRVEESQSCRLTNLLYTDAVLQILVINKE